MAATGSGGGPGFAFMRFPGLLVYSCYGFEGYLSGLETNLRNQLHPDLSVVVAGDLNAHARSWGSSADDPRGVALERFAASLGL